MNGSARYPLVMLVDDNDLDIIVNKKLLETENFSSQVVSHTSAQAALDYLKSNAGNSEALPTIIFLDIMMPGMDGFGFLDAFGKLDDSVKKKTRIVMLSTTESFKDLNRANQSPYVYKFLNKPLTAGVLKALNV
jgi:CheY-like chemotaxis protein